MGVKTVNKDLSKKLRNKLYNIKSNINTKRFTKMINEEWDLESLNLMQQIISKRIYFLQKMHDSINPRKIIKGFK